jgi:glucose-6-phosphate 1-dehydrogenase
MRKANDCIIVIFGGSGDLTRRKLIPALYQLYCQNLMPEKFFIIALGRKTFPNNTFRERMSENLTDSGKKDPSKKKLLKGFLQTIHYQNLDSSESTDYLKLKKYLDDIVKIHQIPLKVLFYLAVPPDNFTLITKNLAAQGLNIQQNEGEWKRIILEKPFGHDLNSAQTLNQALFKLFNEDQIYRIDHYLGKETVQNILAFRFSNAIFESLWNRNSIHHIEITASENIGVGERGAYYDQAGALRDMIQNHLLQIVAIIAAEPPTHFDAGALHNEKVKIFNTIRPYTNEEILTSVIRGQYIASKVRGSELKAYRDELNVDPQSKTETFVAMKFFIDNWRWGGVPFYIRTGKRLPTRVTEAVIHFQRVPHILFSQNNQGIIKDNRLVLRIQPDEGILLKFGMKLPGANFTIKDVDMDFHYSDISDGIIPEAYERLLLDALLGDSTLYARADEVEASWRFITPILEAWKDNREMPLYGYPAGTWGPPEARNLFTEAEDDWRYPCKNLTGADNYCEL